jgi:hypothetical protein
LDNLEDQTIKTTYREEAENHVCGFFSQGGEILCLFTVNFWEKVDFHKHMLILANLL